MKVRMLAAALSIGVLFAAPALSAPSPIMIDEDRVAANGYDVVAYFDGRATRGLPTFSIEYRGVTWYFETPANAERFKQAPDRYEPKYGGYCAYGVSQGYLVKTDPEAWSVVDGVLYLNYNPTVRNQWLANRDNYITVADKHWPRLIE